MVLLVIQLEKEPIHSSDLDLVRAYIDPGHATAAAELTRNNGTYAEMNWPGAGGRI